MTKHDPEAVDAYLAELPDDERATLQDLRLLIDRTLPRTRQRWRRGLLRCPNYVSGDPSRDPRMRVVSVAYLGLRRDNRRDGITFGQGAPC